MKHKFLNDLGIGYDSETEDLLKKFDLNGFIDQVSDNRLKDEEDKDNKINNDKEN